MALYHEAADYLSKAEKFTDSLSSHIYGNKGLKSKPAQVYALVVEAAKWSAVVSGVIEQAGLLKIERKVCRCVDMI
jgi:putative methyltransferase